MDDTYWKQRGSNPDWNSGDQQAWGMIGAAASGIPQAVFISNRLKKEPWYDDYDSDIFDRAFRADTMGLTHPAIKKHYTNEGIFGLDAVAEKVWQHELNNDRTPHIPADLSKAHTYTSSKKPNTHDILTITPDSKSSRFAHMWDPNELDNITAGRAPAHHGGAASKIWGTTAHSEFVPFSYAENNYRNTDGLGKYGDTPNPSAHFTSATLDPATKGNYQTTSDAMKGNHWDSPWGGTELTVEDGGDVVLRKDLINPDKRGVTTANDIFTYLQSKGKTTPDLTGLSNSQKLKALTAALRKTTGASTDFEALKDLASPTETFSGSAGRETGRLPETYRINWEESTPKQIAIAGGDMPGKGPSKIDVSGSPFTREPMWSPEFPSSSGIFNDRKHDSTKGWGDKRFMRRTIPTTNSQMLKPDIITPPKTNVNKILKNHSLGLAGTLLTAPIAIKQIEDELYGDAALTVAGSHFAGEGIGYGFKKAALEGAKRGHMWIPKTAALAAKVANPISAIEMAAMAEKSSRNIDHNEFSPEGQEKISQIIPSSLGKGGPDMPNRLQLSTPEEIDQFDTLPKKQQYVKQLPPLNQTVYNTKNELDYIGDQFKKGKIPYWPW